MSDVMEKSWKKAGSQLLETFQARPGRHMTALLMHPDRGTVFAKVLPHNEAVEEKRRYEEISTFIPRDFRLELIEGVSTEYAETLIYNACINSQTLDRWVLGKALTERFTIRDVILSILQEGLSQAHWGEGRKGWRNVPPVRLPPLPSDRPRWVGQIKDHTERMRSSLDTMMGPVGVIHGDLHMRNIHILDNHPVILDYGSILTEGCVTEDYVRLEMFFALHVPDEVTWQEAIDSLLFFTPKNSRTNYILDIASIIRTLWVKNIYRSYGSIDTEMLQKHYRLFLLRDLIWVMSKANFPDTARQRAYESAKSLSHLLFNNANNE